MERQKLMLTLVLETI